MTESLERIEHAPDHQPSEKVNPADRSNPEKKDNGFSNALKEKMKEKLKKKHAKRDEVILKSEPDVTDEPEEQSPKQADTENVESEPEADETPVTEDSKVEHIDLTA